MAQDKKISDINRYVPMLSDVVVAARDQNGNKLNVTFTLADVLASITGSPFKITSADPSYNTVQDATDPDNIITNSVITDERLIGKSGYPVSSTQTNTEFRNSDLVYDAVNGKVTIKNFSLIGGEHISIYPTLAPSNSGANYQDLLDKFNELSEELNSVKQGNQDFEETLEELQLISAPLKNSIVWFNKPANEIPPGWAEATEWRGRIGVGLNPNDDDFKTLGAAGGSKTHTNTEEEMFPHDHDIVTDGDNRLDNNPDGFIKARQNGDNWQSTKKTEVKGGVMINGQRQAKPYSIMNPYRVVLFIKWVGI